MRPRLRSGTCEEGAHVGPLMNRGSDILQPVFQALQLGGDERPDADQDERNGAERGPVARISKRGGGCGQQSTSQRLEKGFDSRVHATS